MWNIFNKILGVLLEVSDIKKAASALDTVKIRAVRTYVCIVDGVRRSAIIGVMVVLSLMLLAIGFVGIHVGIFLLLDLDSWTIGIVSLCLSALYFIVSLVILLRLTSEKTWMRTSKASDMVRKVAGSSR